MKTLDKFRALSKWKRLIIMYLIVGIGFGIHNYLTFTCSSSAWFCWDSGLGLFITSILMIFLYPLKLIILFKIGNSNL